MHLGVALYEVLLASVTLFKLSISPLPTPLLLVFGWIDDIIDLEPVRDRIFASVLEYSVLPLWLAGTTDG